MTDYKRGDVVLIRYEAPDSAMDALRPAVIVSTETYYQGREQVVLLAATSNMRQSQVGDTAVTNWEEAGLLGPSLVTGVLLTVTPDALDRKLGTLAPEDLLSVESSLRLSLGV